MYIPLIIVVCGIHGFSRGVCTVNSSNCGQFGTPASVLYSESVFHWGVGVISSPILVVITLIMSFDIQASS